MESRYWGDFVKNPPVPKRSLIYCLIAALTTILALVKSLAQEPVLGTVLTHAGFGVAFWIAASLVWRRERRNESPKLDEFLRDPLVKDKYTVHYFCVMSMLASISAIVVFFIEWSMGVVTLVPAAIFGYLAYVSDRKKKSTVEQLN